MSDGDLPSEHKHNSSLASDIATRLAATAESAIQAEKPRLVECITAFLDGEYRTASRSAGDLADTYSLHLLIQIHLISLQRLGELEGAAMLASILGSRLESTWERTLLNVTVGAASLAGVLAQASDDESRAQCYYYAGALRLTQGDIEGARQNFEDCVSLASNGLEGRLARHELAHPTELPLSAVYRRAASQQQAGEFSEAEAAFRRLLERTDPPQHEMRDWRRRAQIGLYEVLLAQGRSAEAVRIGRETLLEERPELRASSAELDQAIQTVTAMYQRQAGDSRSNSTDEVFDSSLFQRTQAFFTKQKAIAGLANSDRLDEAITAATDMEPEARELFGEESPRYFDHIGSIALLYRRSGRLDRARTWNLREIELLQKCYAPDHPSVVKAWQSLIETRGAEVRATEADGQFETAFDQAEELLGLIRQRLGTEHEHYVGCLILLVELSEKAGNPMAAFPYAQEIMSLHQSTGGAGHPAFSRITADPDRLPAEPSIAVFLSSTFRDMQAERDVLVKRVFPKLRAECEQRGVTWTEIDLRWGVTEEQTQRQEVLRTCFHAVDRCRPYFIGMLGERYGWAPPNIDADTLAHYPWLREYPGRSITELEIVHGVIRNKEDAKYAFFYFRNPDYVKSLLTDQQADFGEWPTIEDCDEYGPDQAERLAEDRKQKLAALKERIRNSGATVREEYASADELGELVLQDLLGVIEDRFPARRVTTVEQRERQGQTRFVLSRSADAWPRLSLFRKIDDHIWTGRKPLVVSGPEGCGKTTLLASWCRQFRLENPAARVVYHFVGATQWSASPELMLRHVIASLGGETSGTEQSGSSVSALLTRLSQWLRSSPRNERLILVLDGLERLHQEFAGALLQTIPEQLQHRVSVVVALRPGGLLDQPAVREYPRLSVEPLSMIERREMTVHYLARFNKRLLDDQVTFVATQAPTGDPLYLRVLLDELRIFGEYDALDTYLDDLLKAATVEQLLARVLDRLEREHKSDRRVIGDALALLACADRGLSEVELRELLGAPDNPLPAALWAPVFLALEPLLYLRDGRIEIGPESFRRTVHERYLGDQSKMRQVHRRCAEYFQSKAASPRTLHALVWHLSQSDDPAGLRIRLEDPEFIRVLGGEDPEAVAAFWSELESRDPKARLEDVFAISLDTPLEDPQFALVLANVLARMGRDERALQVSRKLGEIELDQELEAARNHLIQRLDTTPAESAVTPPPEPVPRPDSQEAAHAQSVTEQGDEFEPEVQAYLANLKRSGADPEIVETEVLFFRANSEIGRQHTAEAVEMLEKAQAVYEKHNIPQRVGLSLIGRVNGLRHLERIEPALILAEQAAEIYRELDDSANLRLALMMKADLLGRLGRIDEGRANYREAIAVCRKLGDTALLPELLIGYAQLLDSDDEQAQVALDEAERLYDEQGNRLGVIRVRSIRQQRSLRGSA